MGGESHGLSEVADRRVKRSTHMTASSGDLRPLKIVTADCAAATARLVHDRQACRAMFGEFPSRVVHGFIRTAAGGRGTHDLFNADFGCKAVISRHAATHVALGDDADQLEWFCILNHRLRSRSLN